MKSTDEIKIYFVTIPAHKFLHIKNYESNGYWDFWQKQGMIPGQDQETICGLLDSIVGKLDDDGGSECNSGSGQVMAYINDPEGRLCDWGIISGRCVSRHKYIRRVKERHVRPADYKNVKISLMTFNFGTSADIISILL